MKAVSKSIRFVWVTLLFLASSLAAGCSDAGDSAADEALAAGCLPGQQLCFGACSDPAADSLHCGACGVQCPAGTGCVQGTCTAGAPSTSTSCAANEVVCAGACTDPMVSDTNCGSCGLACGDGEVCDFGACRPIGDGCPTGRTLCDGACIDLQISAANCGTCGNSCGTGTCAGGACSCSPGTQLCSTGCTDVTTDPSHCGACELTCPMGGQCLAGTCSCPPGQGVCDDACTDTLVDPMNCGVCGTTCLEGQSCNAGSCECMPGLSLCTDACVDLMATDTDCGMCGNECTGGRVCTTGTCECLEGQSVCDDACYDLQASTDNCGMCGVSCVSTQVCNAGSCECPDEGTLCGDTCADTTTSTDHCGACDNVCATGQLCNAGTCECPEGEALCGDACVDIVSNDLNCGGCGIECTGGQTCTESSCECPEGESFCDEECIDTSSDDLNCGDCGVSCGLGELCNASACLGGGLGDDGCEGVAQDISLAKVSIYQTFEIPIMDGGEGVGERNAGVVAGRQSLLRVFVEPGAGFSTRELSGRLFLDNPEDRVTLYTEGPQQISGASSDEDRDSTFDFYVDGEVLTDQTRYAVELVECGDDPGGTVQSPRYPEQDGADMNAIDAGTLLIHLVPMEANGMLPDMSDEELERYRQGFLATYPISNIEFTIGDPFDVPNPQDWGNNLDRLRGLRNQEGAPDDVYYYGMLRPTNEIREFCGGGCTAGVGYVPTGGQFGGGAEARVSMGLAYPNGGSGVGTMLHEIGHNHGRSHSPCVPPGASISGVDGNYPYDNADIGVWGYDFRSDQLIEPDHPDIMAYCDNPWFSDYTYQGLLNTIIDVNNVQQTKVAPAELIGSYLVLLVEDGRAPRWGIPRPGPAVALGAPEQAEVLDASGTIVESITVYRTEISEIQAYSIEIPEPQPGWHSVLVQGAGVVAF